MSADKAQNPPTPCGLGEALRRAREKKNLTIGDVAQSLKFGINQIEAIESENWKALPGRVFVVGFVRNYARFLELDLPDLTQQLNISVANEKQRLEIKRGDPIISARATDRNAMSIALIILFVAALAYFFLPKEVLNVLDDWLPKIETRHFGGENQGENEEENEKKIEFPVENPVFPPDLPQALPAVEIPPLANPSVNEESAEKNIDEKAEVKEEKAEKMAEKKLENKAETKPLEPKTDKKSVANLKPVKKNE